MTSAAPPPPVRFVTLPSWLDRSAKTILPLVASPEDEAAEDEVAQDEVAEEPSWLKRAQSSIDTLVSIPRWLEGSVRASKAAPADEAAEADGESCEPSWLGRAQSSVDELGSSRRTDAAEKESASMEAAEAKAELQRARSEAETEREASAAREKRAVEVARAEAMATAKGEMEAALAAEREKAKAAIATARAEAAAEATEAVERSAHAAALSGAKRAAAEGSAAASAAAPRPRLVALPSWLDRSGSLAVKEGAAEAQTAADAELSEREPSWLGRARSSVMSLSGGGADSSKNEISVLRSFTIEDLTSLGSAEARATASPMDASSPTYLVGASIADHSLGLNLLGAGIKVGRVMAISLGERELAFDFGALGGATNTPSSTLGHDGEVTAAADTGAVDV